MMQPSAKVICDSLSPHGERLITLEVVFHRFVLSEMNTHRIFSRNSASSRAIPLIKQIDKVVNNPAMPVIWASEQKGMSGGNEIEDISGADLEWLRASAHARASAQVLGDLGVHKSLANRLLEPFMWHTAVITATGWRNFEYLRCSPEAQPEIRECAEAMMKAMSNSTPRLLQEGQWHLPYVSEEDKQEVRDSLDTNLIDFEAHANAILVKVSAARCARVSYLTQDGKRDRNEDIRLYEQLTGNGHYSPLEHVATPDPTNRTVATLAFKGIDGDDVYVERAIPLFGNLIGWRQHRVEVEVARGWEPLR